MVVHKTEERDKLFELMSKNRHPPLWVHPQNISFVRSNFPHLPIACALGGEMLYVLNGEHSFFATQSAKVQIVAEEEEVRSLINCYFSDTHGWSEGAVKFQRLRDGKYDHQIWFQDDIIPKYWDKYVDDLSYLYSHDGRSRYFGGTSRVRLHVQEAIEKGDYTKAVLHRPLYLIPEGYEVEDCYGNKGKLEYNNMTRWAIKGMKIMKTAVHMLNDFGFLKELSITPCINPPQGGRWRESEIKRVIS